MTASRRTHSVLGASLCCTLVGCSLQSFVIKKLFVPTVEFDPQAIPAAPDYSQSEAWLSRPERTDHADLRLPGAADRDAGVPLFFIHPTTFLDKRAWVQDPQVDDASTEMLEQIVLPSMISMFNECCEIYAPRYRSATLGSYYVPPEQATPVFRVAYEDVDRAFSAFIKQDAPSGPFLIASHSQGSMHAHRLLRRVDADPNLRARLVAAYVPGHKLPMSAFGTEFEHLLPCTEASQSACIASWNTVGNDYDPYEIDVPLAWRDDAIVVQERQPIVCTNPVTGASATTRTDPTQHRGGVITRNAGNELDFKKVLKGAVSGLQVTGLEAPLSGLVSTGCDAEGVFRVDDIRELYPPAADEDGEEYHFYDLSLFYVDVQQSALQRVESWQQRNAQPAPSAPTDGDP